MADSIKSIDELRKAQAAAQEQGMSITNYDQWAEILQDLDTAGIESTGSYEGDVRLHSQIMEEIQEIIEQAQEIQKQEQSKPTQDENLKIDDKASNDRQQDIKANVANATSSAILAEYMKYYHLLG
ncbi:hypothetical protein IJ579_08835 [bacterium]|nr:hypothetical protein [bacterium]